MKKLTFIFIALLFVISAKSQLLTKQIAFGAKGIDSISGAVTAYYYFNTAATVAAGKTVSTAPITQYSIYSIQVQTIHPLVYTASDSCQITFEISNDNVNWFKWTNAGATTPTTQTQYLQGGPKIVGSNAAYVYTGDLVTTTSTDAGCLFMPKDCYAQYSRVKIVRYKASSATYPKIWYTLKKITNN